MFCRFGMPARLMVFLAFAGVASTARCEARDAGRQSKPNFLVVVTDDQRPDTIGALGNPHIRTPTLDRLVREGLAFTRAIAPDPLCVPSRAEILTGCREFANGVSSLGGGRIRQDLTLWGDAMRSAGYHAWYVGKWMNDGKPTTRGYDQTRGLFAAGGGRWARDAVDFHGRPVTGYRGWVFQGDDGSMRPELGVGLTPDISTKFADAAIELIRRGAESPKPFFLHVNFTAPHDPLLMPPGYTGAYKPGDIPLPNNFLPRHPFDHGNLEGRDEQLLPWPRTPDDVRADLAVYYAVITHMDEQLGRVLEAVRATGQAERTYVIFTSDNGLAIGSHGLRGKQNMYEHTVGVPLLLSGPGVPKNEVRATQCYLRDLYPTVCELAGVPIPPSVQGRSLVAAIHDGRAEVYPHVFGHFQDVQRMIRTERWKLIHYPKIGRFQLFDLGNDPLERENLFERPEFAAISADLRARLETCQKEAGDPLLNP
ncbi:MAG: sulfatase-like hydrolase/transferase [Thermoguttaceae bacterium]